MMSDALRGSVARRFGSCTTASDAGLQTAVQVEELVAGTNSGKSPQLTGYYSYWEMAVFNALVLMVLKALEKLHNMLRSSGKRPLFKVRSLPCSSTQPSTLTKPPWVLVISSFEECILGLRCRAQAWYYRVFPALQLKTSLQNSEVVVAPPVKEATKLLSAYIKNVAESCREFVRWMDGSCMEMPDQRPKGDIDGDPLVMHFSSEVLRMQQVGHGTWTVTQHQLTE